MVRLIAVMVVSFVLVALPGGVLGDGVDLTPTEDKEYQVEMSGLQFASLYGSRREKAVAALYALLTQMDATQPLPFPFHFKVPATSVAGELRGVAFLDTPEGHFANRSTRIRYRHSYAEPDAELTWKFETQDKDLARAEPMAVDKTIAGKSKRKTEQNLNSATIWTPNWFQAATSVPVQPTTFPPTEFRTINDLEHDYFPDIDKSFGLSTSHPIIVKSVTYQFNTDVKMTLDDTTIKGGFQFTYNSKTDYVNNATIPGFEFTFKLLREDGKNWDPSLIRNGLSLLSYLESTFPLALRWLRCSGGEANLAIRK